MSSSIAIFYIAFYRAFDACAISVWHNALPNKVGMGKRNFIKPARAENRFPTHSRSPLSGSKKISEIFSTQVTSKCTI